MWDVLTIRKSRLLCLACERQEGVLSASSRGD